MEAISQHIFILNQLFELERKLKKGEQPKGLLRHVDRIRRTYEDIGLSYHDPMGESYDETRTDCDATITGESAENLIIQDVIKPIIRLNDQGFQKIVQRAVVIAGNRQNQF